MRGTLQSLQQLERQALAEEGECLAKQWIRDLGYTVYRRNSPNDPYDLRVEGFDAQIWVEVKISQCYKGPKGHRFQADVRQYKADVLIFIARNGKDWPFIIPMNQIRPRRNVAIWSAQPKQYKGQWAPYLGAWDILVHTLEKARIRDAQLALPLKTPVSQEGLTL